MGTHVHQDDHGLHFTVVVSNLPAMNEHPVDIASQLTQLLSKAARLEYGSGVFAALERLAAPAGGRKEGR